MPGTKAGAGVSGKFNQSDKEKENRMDQQERSERGGSVWSAQCAIIKGLPLDKYSQPVLYRARQNIYLNGGELLPPSAKRRQEKNGNKRQQTATNGNGNHQEAEQLELQNAPRGKAVAENGHWIQVFKDERIILLLNKKYANPKQEVDTAKIAELEKTIGDLRAENTRLKEKIDELIRKFIEK